MTHRELFKYPKKQEWLQSTEKVFFQKSLGYFSVKRTLLWIRPCMLTTLALSRTWHPDPLLLFPPSLFANSRCLSRGAAYGRVEKPLCASNETLSQMVNGPPPVSLSPSSYPRRPHPIPSGPVKRRACCKCVGRHVVVECAGGGNAAAEPLDNISTHSTTTTEMLPINRVDGMWWWVGGRRRQLAMLPLFQADIGDFVCKNCR